MDCDRSGNSVRGAGPIFHLSSSARSNEGAVTIAQIVASSGSAFACSRTIRAPAAANARSFFASAANVRAELKPSNSATPLLGGRFAAAIAGTSMAALGRTRSIAYGRFRASKPYDRLSMISLILRSFHSLPQRPPSPNTESPWTARPMPHPSSGQKNQSSPREVPKLMAISNALTST